MATAAEHKVILSADASAFVSSTNKATKSVQGLGQAQKFLNEINMKAAASESPLQAIRLRTAQDMAKLNALYKAGSITLAERVQGVQRLIAAERNQIAAMKGVNGGIRNMRGAFGQLGYQVQDVAVQLQMGQNAFLVFAQQGSQIASIFGAGGAVVGAVMAVGGAIAMSLIPELESAAKRTKRLKEEAEKLDKALRDLTDNFDNVSEALKPSLLAAYSAKLGEQRQKLIDLGQEYATLIERTASVQSTFGSFSDYLEKATGKDVERIRKLSMEMAVLQGEIAKTRRELSTIGGETPDDLATKAIFDQIEAENQAMMIRGENLRKAQEYTKKIAEEDFEFTQDWIRDQIEFEYDAKMEAEKKLQEDVRALRSLGLDNQKKDLQGNFVEQLKLVEQYEKAKTDVEFDSARARQQINENMQKAAVGEFSKGIDALGAYNKKAFKIAKGVKTAEAIMNTYAGANQALAAYPPPFSYIAAAGQIAYGMAQVAQIKSQTFAGRAAGGMVQAGKPYMVGEMGKEMFIPSTSGRIANNNEVEGGMGTTNINFSITTVDARGFDELLNSRRGQIVSMVNRAMNDRGRVGVTA